MGDWDYFRALQELWRRSSYERGLISDPFGDPERAERGLNRMRRLLHELGDPHQAVPAVHVAGSKGKGSTANFVASIAGAAGYRVGLYTSPHLHRFPERIAINGAAVSDDEFAVVAESAAAAAERLERQQPDLGVVSTFELVTAMAFFAFHRAGCELNVIEVGLGGRYDATNVIDPLVSVISRIDLEHTAVLGDTYTEIAYQKAGILRPGIPAVSSPQIAEAADEIARVAAVLNTPLTMGGRDWTWHGAWRDFSADGPWGTWDHLTLGVPGAHQIENACTALAAIHVVNTSGIPIAAEAARAGLRAARWPGRFERAENAGRTIVLDGAHTPAAARALVAAWREELGEGGATVIFGGGADKNLTDVLSALLPIVRRLILTHAGSPRAASLEQLSAAAMEIGLDFEIQPSVPSAIAAALTEGKSPLLVTGSLFVVGEAREALGLATPDPLWALAAPGAKVTG